jgi:hypothetical protein
MYRKSIAVIIALAMVFTAMPLLGGIGGNSTSSMDAYAADGDGSSIVFNYEVDGVIQNTITKSFGELTADTDMTSWKYLAWGGSAYKVYGVSGASDAISIDKRGSSPASSNTLVAQLGSLWSKTVTYGTVRFKQANGTVKEYSQNDLLRRAQFPTAATPTEIPSNPGNTSVSDGVQAFITLNAKSDSVTTSAGDVSSPNTAVTGLTLCTNLDTRDPSNYGPYTTQDERYKALGDMPQNIVEITFVNSTSFNVFQQIGDDARSIAKGYNDTALNGLAKTDLIGFLQYDGGWVVHGTDNYVRIQDLIDDAGLVFNAGDALLIRSSDMFSYRPTYETIQSEKYFFGGIDDQSITTANPTEVGAVIAVGSYGSNPTSGAIVGDTASNYLENLVLSSSSNKRFFIGLSADNAKATTAPGNRFPNYVTEVTVIKDKADVITDDDVVGVETSYKKPTSGAITPEVSITLDDVALVKDKDYTVTYGTNKEAAGAVIVTGKGSVTGTVVKTFEIDDGTKQAAKDLADEKDKALKQAEKNLEDSKKAADDKDTALKQSEKNATSKDAALTQALAKLDTANQKIFKALTPTKGKFKVTAGKKKATIKWKKIATATNGYQIQVATNKKFTKGKKTIKVAKTATVKSTVKKLKKGKTYYFRVRGVAKIGTKTVYTKWSAVRKIKSK